MHLAALSPPFPCFQSTVAGSQRIRRSRFICRDSSGQQPSPINEDLIARLKVAEEEASCHCNYAGWITKLTEVFQNEKLIEQFLSTLQAQRLKKELAAAKSLPEAEPTAAIEEEERAAAAARIDGGDMRRETLAFVGKTLAMFILLFGSLQKISKVSY